MKWYHWVAIAVVLLIGYAMLHNRNALKGRKVTDLSGGARSIPNSTASGSESMWPELTGGESGSNSGKGVPPTVLYGPRVPARGAAGNYLLSGSVPTSGTRTPVRPRGPEPLGIV